VQRVFRRRLEAPVDAVVDLLAVAAIADQVIHAQEAQVMAHRRLGKIQLLAEARDVTLTLRKKDEYVQARLVGEQAKKRGKLFQIQSRDSSG